MDHQTTERCFIYVAPFESHQSSHPDAIFLQENIIMSKNFFRTFRLRVDKYLLILSIILSIFVSPISSQNTTTISPDVSPSACSLKCEISRLSACLQAGAINFTLGSFSSEYVCHKDCVGAVAIDLVQQKPINVILGQRIALRLDQKAVSSPSSHWQLYNVSLEEFTNCNINADKAQPFSNVTQSSAAYFHSSLFGSGTYYFAGVANNILTCRFGLRLQITVKEANCGAMPVCSGTGKCVANYTDAIGSCSCCQGYNGSYCDEYDGCTSSPCMNSGNCTDVIAGKSNNYSCSCTPYYTGRNCETKIDYCVPNLCVNNGTCLNNVLQGNYSCDCLQGFTGRHCEININECASHNCSNNSTCVDKINEFECVCQGNWTGRYCSEDINECNITQCRNEANCINTPGSFYCDCPLNTTGRLCETDLYDNCQSSPCLNKGVCVDLVGSYRCDCPKGFNGSNCEIDIDECASMPCSVQGSTQCIDGPGNYTCVCRSQYTGKKCESFINRCFSNPCLNGGFCVNIYGGYNCVCRAGYRGRNCQDVLNKCSFQPCKNNATCIRSGDFLSEYICNCTSGWTGRNCTEDLNECLSNPCLNSGTCINLFNRYSCNCAIGWNGTRCETNINACDINPCQNGATCTDLQTKLDYTCTCTPGFTGKNCSVNIDDCVRLNANCNNGKCIDQIGNYYCNCSQGWYGKYCDTSRDICATRPCRNSATCENVNTTSGFICACPTGWTGADCGVNIDDCASSPCVRGTCNDYLNYYNCTCPQGYTGQHCETDLNECSSHPCQHNSTCVDQIGKFTCICLQGFNGLRCQNNINECASNPCFNNATCVDGINKYSCQCLGGYTGVHCEIPKCQLNPCRNGATCLQQSNRFVCQCVSGYTGPTCNEEINECLSNPCKNGTCVNLINDYRCDCSSGFTGRNCETHLCDTNVCKNNATCTRSASGYTCTCAIGYTGSTCDIEINECLSNPCNATGSVNCTDLIAGYECFCKGGYTGSTCATHICDSSQPCRNNATCVRVPNSYRCQCLPGYSGTNCDADINECISNPCNNGTCIDLVNGYKCNCSSMYTGVRCETNMDKCLSNPCFNNGTCINNQTSLSYRCNCQAGYTGRQCQQHLCDALMPCQNNATCLRLPSRYSCQCLGGYTGINCEQDINECLSSPCLNSGSCQNRINSYKCLCPKNYTGSRCETFLDYCVPNPCNLGRCSSDYTFGTFNCSCPSAYSGRRCETHICDTQNPCRNGATCIRSATNAMCQCLPGYAGQNCSINVNECSSTPCQNKGTCVDGINSFTCSCPVEFTGIRCETAVNYCSSNPCRNSGTCLNDFPNRTYKCLCQSYATGRNCEVYLGPCYSNPCLYNGTCSEIAGYSYRCSCAFGYSGARCEGITCPCLNSGRCVNNAGRVSCLCQNGYGGSFCEANYGDCRNNATLKCLSDSFCKQSTYGYTCQCPAHLSGSRTCSLISTCNPSPCLNNAVCSIPLKCTCPPGYTGQFCEFDINECLSNPCQNGGQCREFGVNGFRCYCAAGYFGDLCANRTMSSSVLLQITTSFATSSNSMLSISSEGVLHSWYSSEYTGHMARSSLQSLPHMTSTISSSAGFSKSSLHHTNIFTLPMTTAISPSSKAVGTDSSSRFNAASFSSQNPMPETSSIYSSSPILTIKTSLLTHRTSFSRIDSALITTLTVTQTSKSTTLTSVIDHSSSLSLDSTPSRSHPQGSVQLSTYDISHSASIRTPAAIQTSKSTTLQSSFSSSLFDSPNIMRSSTFSLSQPSVPSMTMIVHSSSRSLQPQDSSLSSSYPQEASQISSNNISPTYGLSSTTTDHSSTHNQFSEFSSLPSETGSRTSQHYTASQQAQTHTSSRETEFISTRSAFAVSSSTTSLFHSAAVNTIHSPLKSSSFISLRPSTINSVAYLTSTTDSKSIQISQVYPTTSDAKHTSLKILSMISSESSSSISTKFISSRPTPSSAVDLNRISYSQFSQSSLISTSISEARQSSLKLSTITKGSSSSISETSTYASPSFARGSSMSYNTIVSSNSKDHSVEESTIISSQTTSSSSAIASQSPTTYVTSSSNMRSNTQLFYNSPYSTTIFRSLAPSESLLPLSSLTKHASSIYHASSTLHMSTFKKTVSSRSLVDSSSGYLIPLASTSTSGSMYMASLSLLPASSPRSSVPSLGYLTLSSSVSGSSSHVETSSGSGPSLDSRNIRHSSAGSLTHSTDLKSSSAHSTQPTVTSISISSHSTMSSPYSSSYSIPFASPVVHSTSSIDNAAQSSNYTLSSSRKSKSSSAYSTQASAIFTPVSAYSATFSVFDRSSSALSMSTSRLSSTYSTPTLTSLIYSSINLPSSKASSFTLTSNPSFTESIPSLTTSISQDICIPNPCLQNGTCTITSPSTFSCTCPIGYGGRICDNYQCQCQNDGRCVRYSTSEPYRCVCKVGFNGTLCENSIANCRTNNCSGNGVCRERLQGFVCHCNAGFYGDRCQHYSSACSSNLCGRNGFCVTRSHASGGGFTCVCRQGFQGQFCQFDYNECSTRPCLNSGQCREDAVGSYKCYCPSWSNGTNCEILYSTSHMSSVIPSLYGSISLVSMDLSRHQSTMDFAGVSTHQLQSTRGVSSSTVIELAMQSSLTSLRPTSTNFATTSITQSSSNSAFSSQATGLLHASTVKIEISKICLTCFESTVATTLSTISSIKVAISTTRSSILALTSIRNSSEVMSFTNQRSVHLSTSIADSLIQSNFGSVSPISTDISNPRSSLGWSVNMDSTSTAKSSMSQQLSDFIQPTTADVSNSTRMRAATSETFLSTMSLQIKSSPATVMSTKATLMSTKATQSISPHSSSTTTSILPPTSSGGIKASSSLVTSTSDRTSSVVPTLLPTTQPWRNLTCADNVCNGNTCFNETVNGVNFRCSCPHPTFGPRCIQGITIHFPLFNGHSYVRYASIPFTNVINTIVMTFRTTNSDGLLLYAGHKTYRDFIMLRVTDGYVEFRFDAGADVIFIRSLERVNTGALVTLVAKHDSRSGTGTLSINGTAPISKSTTSSFKSIQLSTSWYLGGAPGTFKPLNTSGGVPAFISLTGCIKDLQVNDKPYRVLDAASWHSIGECDVPACQRGPCRNNATCIQDTANSNQYTCKCGTGYFGTDCTQRQAHCQGDPCNGGTCVWTPTGHICLCQYGRHGVSCLNSLNITSPTFNQVYNYSSYVEYPWRLTMRNAAARSEIRMQFKLNSLDPRSSKNGLLAFAAQSTIGANGDDFFALGIINNHTFLIYNLGGGLTTIRSSTPVDPMRTWHLIVAGRTGRAGYMYTDSQPVMRSTSPGVLTGLDAYTPLYIGGVPDISKLPSIVRAYFYSGFIGSLYDVSFRTTGTGFTKLLTNSSGTSLPVETGVAVESGLNIGDYEVNDCQPNPCKNNATCSQKGGQFVCSCPTSWTGILCEDRRIPCVDYNPCAAGSICRTETSGTICDCPLGKTGTFCDKVVKIVQPYFKRSSYMGFTTPMMKYFTKISLRFKTAKLDGLLFYVSEKVDSSVGDFFAISLWQGYIYVRFNLGLGMTTMRSRKKITLKKWHSLYVERRRKEAVMWLDSNFPIGCRSSGSYTQLNVGSVMYLGGLPWLSALNPAAVKDVASQRDFEGCVSHFTVNDEVKVLNASKAVVGRNIDDCSGCVLNECMNSASCNATATSTKYPYGCSCSLGWQGDLCDQAIPPYTRARFSGDGYIFHQDKTTTPQLINDIEFTFNTTSDGLLIWVGQLRANKTDYISIGIKDRKLRLSVNTGSGETVVVMNQNLSDGRPHTVSMRRDGAAGSLLLRVNGFMPLLSPASNILDNNGQFYIGGLDGNVKTLSKGQFENGLVGCIWDVKLTSSNTILNLNKNSSNKGFNVKSCS